MENLKVRGYYSLNPNSSREAAEFTESKSYGSTKELVSECDMIFLTVPDGSIKSTWEEISGYDVEGKLICHCSGAISSEDAFLGIEKTGAFGYSVHPLFAVSDKYKTYRELTDVFFTLEGCRTNPCRNDEGEDYNLCMIRDMLSAMGNPSRIIEPDSKTKYHCGAAAASNLVCGLADLSIELFCECGFSEDEAVKALAPILMGNMKHIAKEGPTASLTGPVERNDVGTVRKHLECFEDESGKNLYSLISKRLVKMAQRRHPERDYSGMSEILGKDE